MMKKILFLLLAISISNVSMAQDLTYKQLFDLFTTCKSNQLVSTLPVLNKLHDISNNWQMHSHGTDKGTRYYVWDALVTKSDTAFVTIYVEEDNTSIRYALRYAFHNKGVYVALQQALVGSGDYTGSNGRITYHNDKIRNEFTTTAMAMDGQPLASRTDVFMTEINNLTPTLYTIDIVSRYIDK